VSQNDFVIANQSAPDFRSDLNTALQALASLSSGATAPATTYSNMLWYDTANNILKMRSEADDAWISIGYLDQTANAFRILDDTQVANTSGTQTGLLGDQATATWETGTSATESLVSPAKVKAAIEADITGRRFESSGQTLDGDASVSHGLGAVPFQYSVVAKCTSANNGYSVGDEISLTSLSDAPGVVGYNTYATSTVVGFRANGSSPNIRAVNKTTGSLFTLTSANWQLVFRASI
jgi:hypothetical protein